MTSQLSIIESQQTGTDIAVQAAAAQTKAAVESRYVMAMRNPRNWDVVRQNLLKECRRPSFANNKSTLYRKPIGKSGIEGLGIRFVEVAIRCMTNVLIETTTVHDNLNKEILRVTVTDLEANISYPIDVHVTKTVERSKPMDDGTYISVRNNSYGRPVYTIPATDEDLLNKRNAAISKAIRTLGLRIIPGDLQDEAEEIIRNIRLNEASEDPEKERKAIIDAFSTLGVQPSDLQKYLGHDIAQCSPKQLVDLRGYYGAIKDGQTTWSSIVSKKNEDTESTGVAYSPTPQDETRSQALAAKQVRRGINNAKTKQEVQNALASNYYNNLAEEDKQELSQLAVQKIDDIESQ